MLNAFVALVILHAVRMRRIILSSGLSASTILFHIISYTARFSGEKLFNIKFVFWTSLQLFFSNIRHSEKNSVRYCNECT